MQITLERKRIFLVAALLLWCIILIIGRLLRDDKVSCFFLLWNLFLAFIPLWLPRLSEKCKS